MRFLVDAQLPPAMARWIESQGHAAEHVADVALAAASDTAIWDYAKQNAAVIVTKDEDFAIRRTLNASGPVVVWIRLQWFEPIFGRILESLQRGEALIEVT